MWPRRRTNVVLAFFAIAFGSQLAAAVLRWLNIPMHGWGWLESFGISAAICLGAALLATKLTPQPSSKNAR